MKPYIIIGGGISGLLAATCLNKKGIPFLGLEQSERLGGRIEIGHHRIYKTSSTTLLDRQFPELKWDVIEDLPLERRKGEWFPLREDSPEEIQFYLGQPFYRPVTPYSSLVESLASQVGASFHTRKRVTQVSLDTSTLDCDDGSQYEWEKIIWCADVRSLLKVWDKKELPGLTKKLKKARRSQGGINLDWELKSPLFPYQNTVVFSFRFKDKRFHSLGMTSSSTESQFKKYLVSWILFLHHEILDDREEVAKCVRALKRELRKEFPELKDLTLSEKLTFLPSLSCEEPCELESLNLLPRLFYLGPQVFLGEDEAQTRNLDQTLNNFQVLDHLISPLIEEGSPPD